MLEPFIIPIIRTLWNLVCTIVQVGSHYNILEILPSINTRTFLGDVKCLHMLLTTRCESLNGVKNYIWSIIINAFVYTIPFIQVFFIVLVPHVYSTLQPILV